MRGVDSAFRFSWVCVCSWGRKRLAQDQFELTVAGRPTWPRRRPRPGHLVIVDAAGTRFDYERAQRLDSPDGRYLGFFSAVAGQAVRWPISGTGTMLIGDAAGKAWRPGGSRSRRFVPAAAPDEGAGSRDRRRPREGRESSDPACSDPARWRGCLTDPRRPGPPTFRRRASSCSLTAIATSGPHHQLAVPVPLVPARRSRSWRTRRDRLPDS